jgi:hypothetical protein
MQLLSTNYAKVEVMGVWIIRFVMIKFHNLFSFVSILLIKIFACEMYFPLHQ